LRLQYKRPSAFPQVQGVDFRFQEKMRGVVEYMQYREMPSELKRKVREPPPLAQTQPGADGVGSVPAVPNAPSWSRPVSRAARPAVFLRGRK
jgi:hypothetical protein